MPSSRAPVRPSRRRNVPIDLALQGGGSHGAFTWGVLDRLLDESWLALTGVSGTSAGALNAAVLASGLTEGGRAGAQEALRAFWLDVSTQGTCFGAAGGVAGVPWASPSASLPGWNPATLWLNEFLRLFSPYQFNPLDLNPLRSLVERHVNIDALRRAPLTIFVTATSVHTGQPRVFSGKDLSHDALLASACLPQLFRAVQIDGEPYWDGGYSGNPALWPLIYDTTALDIVLVKIGPLVRIGTPDTALEIHDRVNEITFNAGLSGELRAIDFVHRLVQEGRLDAGKYKDLRLHMVADDAAMAALTPSSKLDTRREFLLQLHGLGHAAAGRWLAAHAEDLGRRGTLDLRRTFLAPRRGPDAA